MDSITSVRERERAFLGLHSAVQPVLLFDDVVVLRSTVPICCSRLYTPQTFPFCGYRLDVRVEARIPGDGTLTDSPARTPLSTMYAQEESA